MRLRSLLFTALAFIFASTIFAEGKNTSNSDSTDKQIQQLQTEIKQLQSDKQDNQKEIAALAAEVKQLQDKQKQTEQAEKTKKNNEYILEYAPLVIATPYNGNAPAYDASDLMTNWPSINEDLAILQQKQKHENKLKEQGLEFPERPLIELSGYVEGRLLGQDKYDTPYDNAKRDVDLSGAELDVLAEVGRWASAFMAIAYNNLPSSTGVRFSNSDIYLSRAFATIGNLNEFPIYGTIGQIYVPFGVYSSPMITDSITKTLGRTKQRTFELGFGKSGWYASGYIAAYGGSVSSIQPNSDESANLNNGGANLGYHFANERINGDIGIGWMDNIANASGMQFTGAKDGFKGFAQEEGFEILKHNVSAGNIHANVNYQNIGLTAEYIGALRSFDPSDLTFNGKGADVAALDTILSYNFKILNKPSFLAADYQYSWETLALNLPQQSISGAFGISLWKDTVEKIEYRHDINYNSTDYASGKGILVTPTWEDRNLVILQLDVYF